MNAASDPTPIAESATSVCFRLPHELVARIDAYARAHVESAPGASFSRNAAVRYLLTMALRTVAP